MLLNIFQKFFKIIKTVNFKAWDYVKRASKVLEYICYQCYNYLKNSEVSPCSIGNTCIMSIPDVKDELKSLTQQEQLLINPIECLL